MANPPLIFPLQKENMTVKHRVLLVSIVRPRNDCGVRIVMNRHFIERSPFELHIASSANFADDLLMHRMLSAVLIYRKPNSKL